MNNPEFIQTNFKVPKTCRHEFVLFNGTQPAASIHGTPGKRQIQFHTFGLRPENDQLTLDWMAESVDRLRQICGGNK